MVKYFALILGSALILIQPCMSSTDPLNLKQEYGPELKKAPFVLRHKFKLDTQIDWDKSSYQEREEFLTSYLVAEAKDNAALKEKLKAAADEEHQRAKTIKEERRANKEKLTTQQRAQREKDKAETQRKKDFARLVAENKKNIKELRRKQKQNRQN